MNLNEIKKISALSSSIYYDYSKKKSTAIAKVPIKKIEYKKSYYIFYLSKELTYGADETKYAVRINGELLNRYDYHFIKYYDDERLLFIKFNIEINFHLTTENVQIESDLLFLIENVKTWYNESNYSLCFPTQRPNIPSSVASEKFTPSKEQEEAVKNIKRNPLSYVWGAPGTGKTQFVLARCIADYIQKFIKRNSKHKIIVCAPTNNALEQILFGVFKVLEAENIPTDLVIRLGMPSKKFSNQYPNSCEQLSAQNQINKTDEQIKELNTILTKRKELQKIEEFRTIFDDFNFTLSEIKEKRKQIKEKISELKKQIDNVQYELSKLGVEIYENEQKYRDAQKKSQKLLNRIIKSNKAAVKYEVDLLNVTIHNLKNDEIEKQTINARLNEELKNTEKQLRATILPDALKVDLFCQLEKYDASNLFAIKKILNLLRTYSSNSIDSILKLALDKCQQFLEDTATLIEISKFGELDDAKIKSKLKKLNEELDKLQNKSRKSQIESSSVIALTADRFIIDYEELFEFKDDRKYKIEHIFIDEAAYLCMIKGLILFSFEKPITLLGDHMQLPPIFECSKSLIEDNPELSLWEIPIIYFEELFQNDYKSFLENYYNNLSPVFNSLSKIDLNTTYRFGHNLANILSGTVYSDKFHSNNNENPTKIITVNAVKLPTEKQRVAPNEINAIKDYIEFNKNDLTSFAVLTPYRKQLSALQNVLPYNVNCMTIHASQGQEWDTVIISVVDTFMSRDVKIINTAVSRAKKQLIVVCDADNWKMYHKYLISKIVSHSDKTIKYININSYKE